jgi:hypothetical protein
MKNLIFILVLMLAATAVSAQKTNSKVIPVDIKSKFESLYPQVKDVKWSQEEGSYEAEFKDKDAETSVVIDAKGNLLETEQEIPVTALPESVTQYIAGNYPGEKTTEAAKILDYKGTVTYEAEVGRKEVMFDGEGRVMEEKSK